MWLRSEPASAPFDAEGVSTAYDEEVLPRLLKALASPSPLIVRAACSTVRKLGAAAAPAVPILTAIAESPLPRGADIQQEYARMDALHALGDILAEIERVRQREIRLKEDTAEQERLRREREQLLLDAERRTALAQAEAQARTAEAEATRAAADAVFEVRRLDAATRGESDPKVQGEHETLAREEAQLDPTLSLLLQAARDPDSGVREAAWDSFGGLQDQPPAVLEAARVALSDEEPAVRRAVARALGRRPVSSCS